jgi:hypothetical protein
MSVLEREALSFWEFFVVLIFDTLKNLLLLGALSLLFFAAKVLRHFGMSDTHVGYIEELHFWLTLGSLGWIAAVFLSRLITRSLKK